MASGSEIEDRVASLEQEMERLKLQLQISEPLQGSWVDAVSGTFEGDEAFRDILKFGKEHRDAQSDDESA